MSSSIFYTVAEVGKYLLPPVARPCLYAHTSQSLVPSRSNGSRCPEADIPSPPTEIFIGVVMHACGVINASVYTIFEKNESTN